MRILVLQHIACEPPAVYEDVMVERGCEIYRVELDEGETMPGWTAVPGRIHQGTYLGDQTEFRVQTDLAGELIVRRQNATGAGASQGLGPGDPVLVRWLDAANLVLAD